MEFEIEKTEEEVANTNVGTVVAIYGMIIWIIIGLLNSITLVRKYLRR